MATKRKQIPFGRAETRMIAGDPRTFDICPECGADQMRGVYAIAQIAMGHTMVCTCPNGHQFRVH